MDVQLERHDTIQDHPPTLSDIETCIVNDDVFGFESLFEGNPNGSNGRGIPYLVSAIVNNATQVFYFLLNSNVRIDCRYREQSLLTSKILTGDELDFLYETDPPILFALRRKRFQFCDALLEKGATLSRNGIALFPMDMIAESMDIVQFLLERNLLDVKWKKGMTPLMASLDRLDIVQLLVQSGVDIHALHDDGFNAVTFAAVKGNLDTFDFLIDSGAHFDNVTNKTALCHVLVFASNHCKLDLARKMLETVSADGDVQRDLIPLHNASLEGHLEMCRLLLEAGAQVDLVGQHGMTSLMYAAAYGMTDACSLLLDHGADINATTPDGHTALSKASSRGHLDTVRLLVERGARITSALNRYNPLGQALLHLHFDILDYCLGLETINKRKILDMLLQYGCIYSRDEIVIDKLVQVGANVHLKLSDRTNLLWPAILSNNDIMVEKLLKCGVFVNQQSKNKTTALMIAAQTGNIEMCELLIQNEANIASRDKLGNGCLDYCRLGAKEREDDNTELEIYLRRQGAKLNQELEPIDTGCVECTLL